MPNRAKLPTTAANPENASPIPVDVLRIILTFAFGTTDAKTFVSIALASKQFYQLTQCFDLYRLVIQRDLTLRPCIQAGESTKAFYQKYEPYLLALRTPSYHSQDLIFYAAQYGLEQSLRRLHKALSPSERRTAVMLLDENGENPLHLSVRRKNIAALRCLLTFLDSAEDKNTLVMQLNANLQNPVHHAALTGSLEILIALFMCLTSTENQMSVVMQRDRNGAWPLHYAAQSGVSQAIFYILANIPHDQRFTQSRQPDNNGMTPIHWVSRSGNQKAITTLFDLNDSIEERRMIITLPDHSGSTSFHYAAMSHNPDGMNLLLATLNSDFARETAVTSGNTNGRTPIHLAAENGSDKILSCLLECIPSGARRSRQLFRRDDKKFSPIHYVLTSEKSNIDLLSLVFSHLSAAQISQCINLWYKCFRENKTGNKIFTPHELLQAIPQTILIQSLQKRNSLSRIIQAIPELNQAYHDKQQQTSIFANDLVNTLFNSNKSKRNSFPSAERNSQERSATITHVSKRSRGQ